jgi:RNA polymerase sigma factor (sigma-70 family)
MNQDPTEKIVDADLWKQFLSGNEQAFERLYRSYYAVLFNYGYRVTSDKNLTREAIQHLFVKLWTNRRNLSPTPHVKQYLFKAFRNQLLTLQELYRRELPVETYNVTLVQDPFEEKIVRRETELHKAQKLQELLAVLTPRQREAIQLRFFSDLSYEEIAHILDMQVGGTYKLIYRALERLRESAPTFFLICSWLIF